MFNSMGAYLRPLVSYRLYMTIIWQKKTDLGEIQKSKKYSQKNVYVCMYKIYMLWIYVKNIWNKENANILPIFDFYYETYIRTMR